MTTVVRRAFKSTPGRDASETWAAIVQILTRGTLGTSRTELEAVAGIASSLIADQAPKDAPITAVCDGPRTRIYCIYGQDAIDGTDVNEEALGFDPLRGDWTLSLPCPSEDLSWVQGALAKHSTRITARELSAAVEQSTAAQSNSSALTLDPKGFLRA